MSKTLVLAEKPSVGRDIATVMNCNKKGNGFFEGDKYIITWALGHLVTHADPEAYDEKYKAWRLEDLPMLPEALKLVVIKQMSKQYFQQIPYFNLPSSYQNGPISFVHLKQPIPCGLKSCE